MDELQKYKWLDAEELKPQQRTPTDKVAEQVNKHLFSKLLDLIDI